jgi:CRISPR/Cas system endoribonuclease Cas6 (RAMP superfamily)
MSYDDLLHFQTKLAEMPELPRDEHGEWCHESRSCHLDGIFCDDQQESSTTISVSRIANNEPQFDEAELDYQIRFWWSGGLLTMTPEAAFVVANHLFEAAAFCVRNRSQNAWFLTGEEVAE